MKSRNLIQVVVLLCIIWACRTQKVTRVAPDTQTDLSGFWNETDARLVSDKMIPDVLSSPWLDRFRRSHDNKNPVVIVGNIRNNSMEHIDTEVFSKELERALINSGEVRFVANPEEREAVRAERKDQQSYSSYETAKRMARELGADYMLIGNISSISDESVDRRTITMFYTTNLELINIETNEKEWIGNKKIKKIIQKGIIR